MTGGLNTYGYVGGNPLLWTDFLGLRYEDVQQAWNWLVLNYPQLTENVDVFSNPILNYSSASGISYGNSIVIQESYVTDCLNEEEINDLRYTLIHELLHLNLNNHLGGLSNYLMLDIITNGKYHDWVYKNAADILRYWQGLTPPNSAPPNIGQYPK